MLDPWLALREEAPDGTAELRRTGMNQQRAIQAIIAAIPVEVRDSGKVSVITDGVMDVMRKLAPEVIYAIVMAHGPAEPERRLQLLQGRAPR